MREIPLSRPSIGNAEIAAVGEVLRSGWLTHGGYNEKFERSVCDLVGVAHAVSMNSCTSALETALTIAGVRGEVVLPSFTFVASANAVVNAGAKPMFCEIERATRNVTADAIAAALTPRSEAVIVVHYGGQPCAMDAIVALCERNKLLLIEDSAQTLGATWNGRQAGSFGIGCFSFFPTKGITTGEGGMLTCRDGEFAGKVRALIGHGIASTTNERRQAERPWLREAEMAGHNYRLSNMLAAVGFHQLRRLHAMNASRIALAARYDAGFASHAGITRPAIAAGASHVYQMYTIEVAQPIRDRVLNHLRTRGVGASVHFEPPVHLHPFYRARGGRDGQFPISERLARELITLPLYPDLTQADQDYVIETVIEAVERHGGA